MQGKQKAQQGLALLKDAICEYISAHDKGEGIRHADLCRDLGLESDFEGGNRNYLSWAVLGLLLKAGRVRSVGERQARRWFLQEI